MARRAFPALAHPASVLTAVVGSALLAGAGPPPHATRPGAPRGIEARAVKVGAPAPAISLPAADGSRWTLKDVLAHGPAVLVFNRGDW
jgi:hypothetical protein